MSRAVERLVNGILLVLFCLSGLVVAQGVSAEEGETLGAGMSNPGYEEPPEWFKVSFLDLREDMSEARGAGKGLIVFRRFEKARSRKQILEVRDGDVVFGENLALRVQMIARKPLPVVGALAYVVGDEGNGRMLLRVSAIEPKPSD